ncbi:uncharacterized protein FIBRA_07269 [Fibroporia radiculosa]|uniref:Carboxylic ester hydrolase n=1 Tax=Fibroporia radiculosa TaxID=599839 RepID=J4GDZ0_9APHY|nr:uncharacterized protein FIBRA_07269 [Fibroporia radiculosa]CCM05063.1 predicted protein [Fibroporia radiculosa]
MLRRVALFSVLAARLALGAPATEGKPVVDLSYGSFQGTVTGNTTMFLGMPYASPPIGALRFEPPQLPVPFAGVRQATQFGSACPQQKTTLHQILPFEIEISGYNGTASEDCMFINVYTPAGFTAEDNLPVIFWVERGAFASGDSSLYAGQNIVDRSVALGEPVIFVSHNYRLNAFGFLASQEVQDAGLTNIGMRDQRFAMEWVRSNIRGFGGDPTKVTLWGDSSGSLAVALQLVIDNGDTHGLFRAAIMESGSTTPLPAMSGGQPYYDILVENTNCTDAEDTLECLRYAPYEALIDAVQLTPNVYDYQSLDFAWVPRIDNDLFSRSPQKSYQLGLYAHIPLLTGDCDDEGTLFSLTSVNVTTDAEFLTYIQTFFVSGATDEQLQAIAEAYPQDPADGSPFGTGNNYTLSPQYKRIAAFQGDWEFQAPRRFTLGIASKSQNTWAYRYSRGDNYPYLGSYHSSDLPEFFTDVDYIGMDAIINFATNLDPNAPADLPANISHLSGFHWPLWNSSADAPPLFTFTDPVPTFNITSDTYRLEQTNLLTTIALQMV